MALLSPWSDLPQDMLELIFDFLKDPIEIVRCGAACKSWLPIALQVYQKFIPLCFIPTGKSRNSTPVLFNLLTKESRKIHLAEAKGNWICCCSKGWLLIFEYTASPSPYRMQLLNIFSRTQIDLPPITSLPLARFSFDPTLSNVISYPFHWKLLLSKCPLNSDCILFLLRDSNAGCYIISSWKPGEKNWSARTITYRKIYDAILYKGKLYATISDSNHGNFLITCNYQLEVEAKVSIPDTFQRFSGGNFLVKSLKDNCLLVGDGIIGTYPPKKSFKIFEFDVGTKEFREVNDLGGCALFLGPNSLLAKAGSFQTWFKANCIYLFRHWKRDYFVYDLETRNSQILPCECFSNDSSNDSNDEDKNRLVSIWMSEVFVFDL